MRNALDCLRHHTVVGSNHQHHDVGDIGSAGPHFAKCRVTGSINERDQPVVTENLIRSDVLGDPARLAINHVGRANGIQQSRLTVVDMSENCHDRRSQLETIRILFDIKRRDQFGFEISWPFDCQFDFEFQRDFLRRLFVNRIIDRRHPTLLEQHRDQRFRRPSHGFGEAANGDRCFDDRR